MTGETTLKEVIHRLGKAIEGLESAVAAKLEHERDYSESEAEVQRMNADRSRLAQELDNSEARAEQREADSQSCSQVSERELVHGPSSRLPMPRAPGGRERRIVAGYGPEAAVAQPAF